MTIHFTQGGGIKMSPSSYSSLIRFLEEDLAISSASIDVAVRHSQQNPGPLPMILWQYGFVTLDQLEKIYDWLETV
ncbi:MAG: DUF2949 domain-containing protein [Scytonematopsis contorta HA4267-MV1]|jgi:Protein of unknown function (DUF2949)|nr:DUF2949 domain-containing protein [Scytonematopsis contorta HA4267-MV1]